jgi:hypothetical protein
MLRPKAKRKGIAQPLGALKRTYAYAFLNHESHKKCTFTFQISIIQEKSKKKNTTLNKNPYVAPNAFWLLSDKHKVQTTYTQQ